MFRKAKITLLTLVAFLVLGFSITANAVKPSPVVVVNIPDVNVANMPEVTVVNTPDVNVVNTILLDSIDGIGGSSSISAGNEFLIDIVPGFLHGFTLSIATIPERQCAAYVFIRIEEPGGDIFKQLAGVTTYGNNTSIARDFSTPIAVLFDESYDAQLGVKFLGSGICMYSFFPIYQPL